MNLSAVSIRRPVFASVCSLVIALFGAVSFFLLGVREYPAVDPPIITVRTAYAGASAAVIASQVTEPIEQLLNGIAGIRVLSSTSNDERSEIQVEFDIGTDLEAAANDVRDKVAQAARNLPPDADPPVVEKADADAEPIIFLSIQSRTRDILEVNDFADRVIRERMQTIPGVSYVRIFGEKRYAMRLWMDPVRLAAYGLTPLDVQQAVSAQNVDLPSGRLEGDTVELSLRTAGRLVTADEFASMIVKEENGRQILFRDVGRAELGAENLRTGNKRELVPMVGVAVVPQPNTDAIAIADEFHRRLADVLGRAPSPLRDQAAGQQRVVLLLDACRHVGGHDPRPQLDDLHAVLREPHGPQLRDHRQPCFRDAVLAAVDRRGVGRDRGDEDDLEAAGQRGRRGAREPVIGDGLRQEERPLQVDAHELLERGLARLGEVGTYARRHTGVVDERIHPSERLERRLQQRGAILTLADVATHRDEALAGMRRHLRAQLHGLGSRGSVVCVVDRDREAFGSCFDRDATTKTTAGAGDEYHGNRSHRGAILRRDAGGTRRRGLLTTP